MKWKASRSWPEKYSAKIAWHDWYAWYPVRVSGKGGTMYVWLEHVWRKGQLFNHGLGSTWRWEYTEDVQRLKWHR